MVKTLCDQFLASTPLADDENGTIERSGTARPLDGVEKGEALPDELFSALHVPCRSKIRPTVGGKSHHLARIFALIFRSKNALFANL